jgi:hypothetical protein
MWLSVCDLQEHHKKHGGIGGDMMSGLAGAAAGAFFMDKWDDHKEKKRQEEAWDDMAEEDRIRREQEVRYAAPCTFCPGFFMICIVINCVHRFMFNYMGKSERNEKSPHIPARVLHDHAFLHHELYARVCAKLDI